MRKKALYLFAAVAAVVPAIVFGADASTEISTSGSSEFGAEALLSTLLYGVIGIALYVVGYIAFDKIMKLDLRKELVEDQNEALGIMMAGVFIGIGLIIMSAIK